MALMFFVLLTLCSYSSCYIITKEWAQHEANELEGWISNETNAVAKAVNSYVPRLGENCICYHETCGCCIHAVEPSIHLNSTVCVNVTYLSQDYGISFTVTLNAHTLYNETVSVRNPPPVCAGFPYVKELAEVCVRLYNIDAGQHKLHACARLEARMKMIQIAHYDLGCFTIGSSFMKDAAQILEKVSNVLQPTVLQV